MSKIDPTKWTAPPTQYDREKLEEQRNYEELYYDENYDEDHED